MKMGEIPVGKTLFLGRYTASNDGIPQSIAWIKADKDGTFISELVLDSLSMDSPKPRSFPDGSNEFPTSTLQMYLNSPLDDWYKMIYADDGITSRTNRWLKKMHHSGFLNAFSDEEIECLAPMERVSNKTLVAIPSSDELASFELFKRRGVRSCRSADMICSLSSYPARIGKMSDRSFYPFCLRDRKEYTRTGTVDPINSVTETGVRPIILPNQDSEVQYDANTDAYTLAVPEHHFCNVMRSGFEKCDALSILMGVAQP